ncbi:hypothetical protein PI125_g21907 [Phytophthora idaei]|nr:hypothetical protein PI125_g21907 [Phytophthora idaei]
MPASDPSPGATFPTRMSDSGDPVRISSTRSPSESSTVDLASAESSPRVNIAVPPTPPPSTVVPTTDVEIPVPDFAWGLRFVGRPPCFGRLRKGAPNSPAEPHDLECLPAARRREADLDCQRRVSVRSLLSAPLRYRAATAGVISSRDSGLQKRSSGTSRQRLVVLDDVSNEELGLGCAHIMCSSNREGGNTRETVFNGVQR